MTDPMLGQEQSDMGEAAVPVSPAHVVTVPGGEVLLHPAVTMPLGMAAIALVRQGAAEGWTAPEFEGRFATLFLHLGIADWTLTEDGKPVPLTPANIDRLLTYANGGREVAERADNLYSGDIFAPLVAAMPKSSRIGLTDASMSPRSGTGRATRKHSKRSSRSATDGKLSAVPAP